MIANASDAPLSLNLAKLGSANLSGWTRRSLARGDQLGSADSLRVGAWEVVALERP